jgi:hypothetical protein
MRVKVCGMTQLDQVRKLEEIGIDFAGLIFIRSRPVMQVNIFPGNKCDGQNSGSAKLGYL